ncbi:MAG: TauD/TfdA family dioxygenase [Gammaproteobacteria bacterium]|nr:TauD/TfdA family dioxygenase [Gammaproteobacteria bacterium]
MPAACLSTQPLETMDNPFLTHRLTAYEHWRRHKLACADAGPADTVEVADPWSPTAGELTALRYALTVHNMVHYRWPAVPPEDEKEALRAFCRRLGLVDLDRNLYADDDGIAALKVVAGGRRGEYIPYTSRAINWHTDGYYNAPHQLVRAFALHCSRDAAIGGGSRLLDHELAYIAIRDHHPEYVEALMADDAMTIPENVEDGEVIRPRQAGPVFSVDPGLGSLHLRYTARTRSIQWKDDTLTQEAVACLVEVLQGLSHRVVALRLQSQEGVLTSNVLHGRDAFTDDPATGRIRLFYRARFHERAAGTGVADFAALCGG